MIEFIEDSHIYLVEGMIVPSVSDILRFIFPNKYDGIPHWILTNKAEFGTNVHNAIECHENGNEFEVSDEELASFDEYLRLCMENNINVISQEQMVQFDGRYAGRYDMIADVNYYRCLVDIKTTSKLDKEYLSWQLSFYEMASEEKFEFLYAIWLPKNKKGKLVQIERKTQKQLIDKLEEYEKQKNDSD